VARLSGNPTGDDELCVVFVGIVSRRVKMKLREHLFAKDAYHDDVAIVFAPEVHDVRYVA
jgi:hypothetical protein